jgi:hypothetical protein
MMLTINFVQKNPVNNDEVLLFSNIYRTIF